MKGEHRQGQELLCFQLVLAEVGSWLRGEEPDGTELRTSEAPTRD